MATWVTHLVIADRVLQHHPNLNRRGFCVGNIAPDCNIENEDWTAFTPLREVTHWMGSSKKVLSDCEGFRREYIDPHKPPRCEDERYAFLLGYYSHLLTDAAFQQFIRDDTRVKNAWARLNADPILSQKGKNLPQDWDSLKRLISKQERMQEIEAMEAAYLQENPDSGYLTEILPLKDFPDYIDYLPTGCIPRKIGIMGTLPRADCHPAAPISLSWDEFHSFTRNTVRLVLDKLAENQLVP